MATVMRHPFEIDRDTCLADVISDLRILRDNGLPESWGTPEFLAYTDKVVAVAGWHTASPLQAEYIELFEEVCNIHYRGNGSSH